MIDPGSGSLSLPGLDPDLYHCQGWIRIFITVRAGSGSLSLSGLDSDLYHCQGWIRIFITVRAESGSLSLSGLVPDLYHCQGWFRIFITDRAASRLSVGPDLNYGYSASLIFSQGLYFFEQIEKI